MAKFKLKRGTSGIIATLLGIGGIAISIIGSIFERKDTREETEDIVDEKLKNYGLIEGESDEDDEDDEDDEEID